MATRFGSRDSPPLVATDKFAQWVHSALRQLYSFPASAKHPLATLLGDLSSSRLKRAQNLRYVLQEAIRGMRPNTDIPSHGLYRILQVRYLQGLTPDEAMERLALQKSQYYLDQSRALQVLVDRLWERCQQEADGVHLALSPMPCYTAKQRHFLCTPRRCTPSGTRASYSSSRHSRPRRRLPTRDKYT